MMTDEHEMKMRFKGIEVLEKIMPEFLEAINRLENERDFWKATATVSIFCFFITVIGWMFYLFSVAK